MVARGPGLARDGLRELRVDRALGEDRLDPLASDEPRQPRDVARLTRLIRREGVKAVFPESSINLKLAQAIARQTGATSDLTLYGDTLGPKDSSGATYLTMERANADAMVRGFTGGAQRCTVPGL